MTSHPASSFQNFLIFKLKYWEISILVYNIESTSICCNNSISRELQFTRRQDIKIEYKRMKINKKPNPSPIIILISVFFLFYISWWKVLILWPLYCLNSKDRWDCFCLRCIRFFIYFCWVVFRGKKKNTIMRDLWEMFIFILL